MTKINIDIIGTCYSRELFNTTDVYDVKTYLMQQSIFTMFSNPLPITEIDVKTFDGYSFKKRMIYYEFNKLALSTLFNRPSEYLFIDLLNEGRDFYDFQTPQGTKIIATKENFLTLSTLEGYRDYVYALKEVQNMSEDEIRGYFQMFIVELLKHYDKDKIILNKVQMQSHYYEDNQLQQIPDNFIYSRRHFVARLEKIFLDLLPSCKILESFHDPILDINHRFGGPHPLHFEEIYYKYRMDLLDAIINNRNTYEQINYEYLKTLNNAKQAIKAKKRVL